MRYAGDRVAAGLRRALRQGPEAGLGAYLDLRRTVILDGGFRVGCPVLAVAVEEPEAPGGDGGAEGAGERPAALEAAAEAFDTWQSLLASSLREYGTPPEQAGQLAVLIVSAVEGAVAVCRAQRSTAALDAVGPQLKALVGAATNPAPEKGSDT